jgi:hypothetical protein
VGLVERSRVNDPLDAPHAVFDEIPIRDGPDAGRERRMEEVHSDDLVLALSKGPNERLAEMSSASCNEDTHALDARLPIARGV